MDRRVVCYSSFLCLHSSVLSRRIVCCLSFFCLHSSVLSRRIVCYSSFFSRHSSTSRELNSWKERMTRSYLENVLCLDPLMIEDKSWTPRRPGSGSDSGAKTRKTVGLFYNSWFMIHTLPEWWPLKRKCPGQGTKFHRILWSYLGHGVWCQNLRRYIDQSQAKICQNKWSPAMCRPMREPVYLTFP